MPSLKARLNGLRFSHYNRSVRGAVIAGYHRGLRQGGRVPYKDMPINRAPLRGSRERLPGYPLKLKEEGEEE
jgi:hypothetical protein